MEPETSANEILYELLQHCYFDSIDNANARKAVEVFTENAVWIHTQVWEHDGHDSTQRDDIHGRAAICDFLSKRIHEMQAIGFKHKVHKVVCDGRNGAFQASVVMPGTDKSIPFFGWVELQDGRISSYKVFPER